MTSDLAPDPYAALHAHVDHDLPPLHEVLTPAGVALLALAGQHLSTVAYRDAIDYADAPLRRRAAKAAGRVLTLFPADCDNQHQPFRLALARAFADLADDLTSGLAPLPRNTAERYALQIMIDRTPALLALADSDLRAARVPLPTDVGDYWLPIWEDVWSTYAADLGLDTDFGDDESDVTLDQEAADRAMPPGAWFFPVAGLIARDDDRGHPDWVVSALSANALDETAARRCARAAAAIGLTGRPDPWSAYTRDEYAGHSDRELAEVLTPTAAALLARTAIELVDDGVRDLVRYGDAPYPREDELDEGALGMLPEVCDRQDSAWRLGMIRAILDLRGDLVAGRAPLPRCHAEEIALHLLLVRAEENLDLIDDAVDGADYATLNGLPEPAAFSARHRDFTMMREVFLQDEDVLMFYDLDLADVATDPEHPAALALHLDDMSPSGWWWTFGNLQPRPAGSGVPAWIIKALGAHPTGQPGETLPAEEPDVLDPAAVLFERMVGLAQRRFFDRACAVAMATTFADLLTAIIDTPPLSVHRAWIHRRATHADRTLLVDEDFTIDGHTTIWRFRSDLTDAQARAWTLDALDDCATKVIDLYQRAAPDLLLEYTRTPLPEVDPALPGRVARRLRALGAQTTTAMLLRHRRHTLGLTLAQVAEPALLPAAIIAGWERGIPADPAQIIRLAPVLQMPADVLLAAVDGRRAPEYWSLPGTSAPTKAARPQRPCGPR